MSITAFDVVEIGPYLDEMFNLTPSEPVNGQFATVGFESLYVLHNLGTFLLVFVFLLIELIVA